MKILNISEENQGKRLDAVVHDLLPKFSRSFVQKLINDGKILVNYQQEKTGYKLKVGDVVSIDFDEATLTAIPEIELPVIYEDGDCIVINKPVGVLSHSKGAFNPEATVATFIESKVQGLSGDRAGIVHRLDRATSGVMICAKNPDSLNWLQKQFSQRKTKKTYIAIVKSGLRPKEAVIDMPIERDPKSPKQFRVGGSGKTAQTNYKVIKDNGIHALLELKPITGRTHQLRVHLRQLGYPIVGDELYGDEKADRLMLHAKSLELTLPNKERTIFSANVPKEFAAIIK